MSTEVKIGQVWKDKDKRRDTTIEIIAIGPFDEEDDSIVATGLVVGTEEERKYLPERLVKRWTLVAEKSIEVPAPKFKTREQWLMAAIDMIAKKVFAPHDFEVPEVRASVGWPGGRGKKNGVIGQCFPTETTGDKVAQIFVSPVVSDALGALVVVAHELVHAVDDCKSAHKSGFIKIAKAIGFVPKWTVATPAVITDELREKLDAIAEKLGTYPHAAIMPSNKPNTQRTYMLKVLCVEDEDYFVRMTQTKLDDYGAPLCPCHKKEMEVEEK